MPNRLNPFRLLVLLERWGVQVKNGGIFLQPVGELPRVESAAIVPNCHHEPAVGMRKVNRDVPRLSLLLVRADGIVQELEDGEPDVLIAYADRRKDNRFKGPDDLPEIRPGIHREPDGPASLFFHLEGLQRLHAARPFPSPAQTWIMRAMVYVIAELRNYRQLVRLRADGLPGLEAALAATLGSLASPARQSGNGVWLAELGPEEELDAGAAAAAAWRVRDSLAARRSELFGFSVVVAPLKEGPGGFPADSTQRLLEGAEVDDQLWIASECAALFADSFDCEMSGSLYRVLGLRRPADAAGPLPARRGPGSVKPW